jgi:hypothetical protein
MRHLPIELTAQSYIAATGFALIHVRNPGASHAAGRMKTGRRAIHGPAAPRGEESQVTKRGVVNATTTPPC